MCLELGQLSNDFKDITGINTIHFMTYDEIFNIQKHHTVTYVNIVVGYRTQKLDPNKVRITIWGNLI